MQINKAELHAFVVQRLQERLSALGLTGEQVDDGFDFFMSGLLDSFGFIDLLLDIERRYGVELNLDGMDTETLSTFGSLARWLEKHGNG